jgi:hypothetical protein
MSRPKPDKSTGNSPTKKHVFLSRIKDSLMLFKFNLMLVIPKINYTHKANSRLIFHILKSILVRGLRA